MRGKGQRVGSESIDGLLPEPQARACFAPLGPCPAFFSPSRARVPSGAALGQRPHHRSTDT